MVATITLAEYAKRHGLAHSTVRRKVLRGNLKAQKSGKIWLIDEDEPYIDHRTKEFYQESDYYKKRLEAAAERKSLERPKRKYTRRKKDQQ